MTKKVNTLDLLRERITPLRVNTGARNKYRYYDERPFRLRIADIKANLERVPKTGHYGYHDRATQTIQTDAAAYTYDLVIDRDKYIAVEAINGGYTLKDIEAGTVPYYAEVTGLRCPTIYKVQVAVIRRVTTETDPTLKNEVTVEVKERYEFVPPKARRHRARRFNTLDAAKAHLAKYVERKVRIGEATTPHAARKALAAIEDAERKAEYCETYARGGHENKVHWAEDRVKRIKEEIEQMQARLLEALIEVDKAKVAAAEVDKEIAAAKAAVVVAKATADLILAGAGAAA